MVKHVGTMPRTISSYPIELQTSLRLFSIIHIKLETYMWRQIAEGGKTFQKWL